MKKTLISFIGFTCIVLFCKHIVADIKQGERIIVLENALRELQLRLAEIDRTVLEVPSVPETVRNIPKPRQKVWQNNVVYTKKEEKKAEVRKFSNPIVLDLNTVDSATLVKVPGIAEKSAAMILKYRKQLGGFYNPYQLGERLTWESAQERLDEWCNSWFMADERFIRKIDVNRADFKELLRHPYLDYEQTKALVNYREKHHIENIATLKMLEQFTEEDIARLEHYLRFE